MAASFYKWLIIPLGACVLSASTPNFKFQIPNSIPHPFHVSVTEINHNSPDKTLEISCKIFTDDFEKTLAKLYNTKTDLGKADMKPAMDSLIKRYLISRLSVKADGRTVQFNYLGFEIDKEATYSYIEVSNVSTVRKIDVVNSIMYEQFDDQINIMHVTVNGSRQSGKVNYPDKEAAFSF
jgi:hypothetical protein